MDTPIESLFASVGRKPRSPFVCGHRGNSSAAPENTLAAFKSALKVDADAVEMDIHLTQDSEVIAHHDFSLDRTTDGSGEIRQTPWEAIRLLDAGQWFDPKFRGEKVPKLSAVLEGIGGRAFPLVEIKMGPGYDRTLEDRVLELLAERNLEKGALLQSFDMDVLIRLNNQKPGLTLAWIVESNEIQVLESYLTREYISVEKSRTQWAAQDLPPWLGGVHLEMGLAEEERVKEIKGRGLWVGVWTVNSEQDMRTCLELGVDGIITDHPKKLGEMMAERSAG